MKSLIAKAKALHGGQGGFTLIEMMVVLGILAIIVGLVVPNMFGVIGEAKATQIQGQHEKMREAVFQYYADTSEFPTEWSGSTAESKHQLWYQNNVGGWDGPYLDRPILQENRWGGYWGVVENVELFDENEYYTVLAYYDVPKEICRKVDAAMDDGTGSGDGGQDSGVVQYDDDASVLGDDNWYNSVDGVDDDNNLVIAIAKED